MSRFESILVGHDGSAQAKRAWKWAASMASALECSLVAAHAYSVGEFAGGPDSAAAAGAAELARWVSEDVEGPPPERISQVVISGSPGPALLDLVEINHAGLLVLGAHRRPMNATVLGRVVQHATFRSPCPVALARGSGGPVSSAPIVVGFDAARPNKSVVNWAVDLARWLDVRLEAVTVGSDLEVSADDDVFDLSDRSDNPLIDLCSMTGDPGQELLTRADELDASAIVIGQRRQHSLGGRLLGGTASWLLRKSDRPIIVLPHE